MRKLTHTLLLLPVWLLLLLAAGCVQEQNDQPVIVYIHAQPEWVSAGGTIELSCSATDSDGDPLTCSWTATGGEFPGGSTGDSLTWQAPMEPGYYIVTVTVDDGTDTVQGERSVPVLLPREAAIPPGAVKWGPEDDEFPPVTLLADWLQPEPLGGPINTAGGEDSPFITPDGQTLFFFFTPDVSVPAEEQLYDGATGIWWCNWSGVSWEVPERVVLNLEAGLDGCPCSLGDILWFCSVRGGNYGEVDFWVAALVNGVWTGWENAGDYLNGELSIGEVHLLTQDHLFFHWDGEGGQGDVDIWEIQRSVGEWGEPENLGEPVNAAGNQWYPFVSADGEQLWYIADSQQGYAGASIWRSLRQGDGTWGEGEEVIANFAAEPTLDGYGNIYFVHHFISGGTMVEADIYVAWRDAD